jgi:hypothetical protein
MKTSRNMFPWIHVSDIRYCRYALLLCIGAVLMSSKANGCVARLAVITASFGSYDSIVDIARKDVSHCVDYFYFTSQSDSERSLQLQNCTIVTHPYHLEDLQSQKVYNADGTPAKVQICSSSPSTTLVPHELTFKTKQNSNEGIRQRFRTQRAINARINNMAAKYYKVLAWKIPSLAKYRYILFHDVRSLFRYKNFEVCT